MASITADVPIPPRSRTFTQDDAETVLNFLLGRKVVADDDGAPVLDDDGDIQYEDVPPAKNVGFGEFGTAGAARSAGVTLNRILAELGAPHKYAVTTQARGDKFVGIILNKRAKGVEDETTPEDEANAPAPDAPAPDETPAQETRPRRRRRS